MNVHCAGSAVTLLGDQLSDLDTIVIFKNYLDVNIVQVLRDMIPHIKHLAKDTIEFTDKAKVPILTYRDKETNIEVDITCQNPVSYYNTELVRECV